MGCLVANGHGPGWKGWSQWVMVQHVFGCGATDASRMKAAFSVFIDFSKSYTLGWLFCPSFLCSPFTLADTLKPKVWRGRWANRIRARERRRRIFERLDRRRRIYPPHHPTSRGLTHSLLSAAFHSSSCQICVSLINPCLRAKVGEFQWKERGREWSGMGVGGGVCVRA